MRLAMNSMNYHPSTILSVMRQANQKKHLAGGGNRSIHPRVVNGRTVYPKVNTAKPRKST